MKGNEISDREATQAFQVLWILIGHCGQFLTPDRVEEIVEEFKVAMTDGPCSWAFKPEEMEQKNG